MKTLRNYALLLLSLFLTFTACDEREFDAPPFEEPKYTGEANISIEDLKTKYAGQALIEITEDLIIGGIVTANDQSGNIYKQIILQDSTAGICIAINQTSLYGEFRIGQEVFIELKGLYFGLYGGYPQIGYKYESTAGSGNFSIGQCPWVTFEEHFFLNGFPKPDLVKIPELSVAELSSAHVGTVVTVKNVYFERGGEEPFAVKNPATGAVQTESKNLISAVDNKTLIARNSSAANFSAEIMPKGVGSVTGVLSTFNNAYQITFRDSLDCSASRFGIIRIGTKEFPWDVPYALDNQDTDPVTAGWIEGYIVGTAAPGINAESPIKSNSDIIWSGNFVDNTIVLAESADVNDWTKVVLISLPSGSDMYSSVNLMDNVGNLGKMIKVTGELKKQFGASGLIVDKGSASDYELEGNEPEPGAGTKEDPYTVADGRKNQNSSVAWVKGYIVGCVKNGVTSVGSASDVLIGVTSGWDSATNVLIADDENETDYTKCMVVNLPAGTPLRTLVNLKDNKDNLKKSLSVTGKLYAYFGLPGLRESVGTTDDFVLEGGGTEPEPGDAILNVSFTDGNKGGFTTYSVSGAQEWDFHATTPAYGMIMSGFTDKSNANEDWLISPAMDLTSTTEATLTFDHAINKGEVANVKTNHTLWISTNYSSGAPSSATWTQVTITTYPAGTDWAFVSSGNISLPSSVIGQNNVHFAFKYLCSDAESASWEIKNVRVTGDGGSTEPGPGPEPGEFLETFELSANKTGYAAGEVDGKMCKWEAAAVITSTDTNDKKNGSYSVRFRDPNVSNTDPSYVVMKQDKANGAGSISFYTGMYSNHTAEASVLVEVSNDGGSTWTAYSKTVPVTTTWTKVTLDDVNVSGNIRVKFTKVSEKVGSSSVNLDDVAITDYK
ncbi:DUF5689 domain-containing protein [Bacteroidales bacterium OttesenSCG-928-L03]|nr:DUF5689 domain-containing protein [Bacteroidales bacterium OttesenSCG-928-L03]